MATLTEKEIIQELIKAKKIEDLKTEKETVASLAKRLYSTYTAAELEDLYRERMDKEPEKVVDTLIEKVDAIVAKPRTKKEKTAEKKSAVKAEEKPKKVKKTSDKKDPMLQPAGDYPKAWIPVLLDSAAFQPKAEDSRILEVSQAKKKIVLVYSFDTNSISVYKKGYSSGTKPKATTKCLCECITRWFIDKHAGTKLEPVAAYFEKK